MAKQQIRLTEGDLKRIIRNSVVRYLNESADEISPEFLIHASHAADADKKKHPGRGKGSPDPEIRAKRDRQSKAFGSGAAERINQDINDPSYTVHGDRGARTLNYAKDGKSAYLRQDMDDIASQRLYDDNWQEGDAPLTVADLGPDEFGNVESVFNKFKGYHDRAKDLDDRYLEESVKRSVDKTLRRFKNGRR